jgi:hypothetical protein
MTVGASYFAIAASKQRYTKSHSALPLSASYRPGLMVRIQLSAGRLHL